MSELSLDPTQELPEYTAEQVRADPFTAINREVLESFIDDEEENPFGFLIDILNLFMTQTEGEIRAIEEAFRNNDYTIVTQRTHSLKGSSGNLGAYSFMHACMKMNLAGKANQFDQLRELWPRTKREYDLAKIAIEKILQQMTSE